MQENLSKLLMNSVHMMSCMLIPFAIVVILYAWLIIMEFQNELYIVGLLEK